MSQNCYALLLAQTNAEFDGKSFISPNLINTLETISFDALTSALPFEKYPVVATAPHITFRQITA